MPTIVRTTHPTCPACNFRVFNRRCATCEKCGAGLPASIAYTPDELATLRTQDRLDEQTRVRRLEKERAERAQRTARRAGVASTGAGIGLLDVVDIGIDLSDLLGAGD